MKSLVDVYPVFGLRVSCGPLELSAIRDDDIPHLVALAEDGIHDPAAMPFFFPWTDAPPAELPVNMARHYWEARAGFTAESFSLELVVRRDGEVVGVQAFDAKNFAVTRQGETGSWLARRHQGSGTGTLMRQAVCAFAFDSLGAVAITSGAFADNPASHAVSRKVGYRPNGTTIEKRRDGEAAVLEHLVLAPDDLVRPPHPVRVEGLGPLRAFIGLAD